MAAVARRHLARGIRLAAHPSSLGRWENLRRVWRVYIAVALAWLRVVDGIALTRWDVAGAFVALIGMVIIAMQPVGKV